MLPLRGNIVLFVSLSLFYIISTKINTPQETYNIDPVAGSASHAGRSQTNSQRGTGQGTMVGLEHVSAHAGLEQCTSRGFSQTQLHAGGPHSY